MNLDEEIKKEQNVIINAVNQKAIKSKHTEISKAHLGKGKFAKAIDKIFITAAAILEILKGSGIWNYLENDFVANLTSKFNTWVGSLTAKNNLPNFEGLTPEDIWRMAIESGAQATTASADSYGIIFSTILTFVLEHPTVVVLGVTSLTSVLAFAFSKLKNKLKTVKNEKTLENIKLNEKVIKR